MQVVCVCLCITEPKMTCETYLAAAFSGMYTMLSIILKVTLLRNLFNDLGQMKMF